MEIRQQQNKTSSVSKQASAKTETSILWQKTTLSLNPSQSEVSVHWLKKSQKLLADHESWMPQWFWNTHPDVNQK